MAGTPGNLDTGPGWMFVAIAGTALPTTNAAALNVLFRDVGYTEEGNTFKRAISSSPMNVAEELRPVKNVHTGIDESVGFKMAEATQANLGLALNMGSALVNDGSTLNPPDESAEVRVSIILKALTGATWVFKKCYNTMDLEISRKRAPDKALIPVEFHLEIPDAGGVAWYVIPNTSGRF